MGNHFSKNEPLAYQKDIKGQFWVDFQPNDVPFWAKLEWEHFLRINDISMDEKNIDLANNILKEDQDLLREDKIRFHKLETTLRMEQKIFEDRQTTGQEQLRERRKIVESDQKLVDESVIRANTREMNLKKKEVIFEKLKENKRRCTINSSSVVFVLCIAIVSYHIFPHFFPTTDQPTIQPTKATHRSSVPELKKERKGIKNKLESRGELYQKAQRKKSKIQQRIKSGKIVVGIKPQVINSGEDQHLIDLTLKIILRKEKMEAEKKLLKTKEEEILKMEVELYESMATKYGIS
jgi:hypothetical protein